MVTFCLLPNWEYSTLLELVHEKMKILHKDILYQFARDHTDVSKQIAAWVGEVEVAVWGKGADIKQRYSSASFLKNNVVIFNIKGNNYRLEIQVAYKNEIVNVLWMGTHAEYDKRNRER